jgi:hypothetical protein
MLGGLEAGKLEGAAHYEPSSLFYCFVVIKSSVGFSPMPAML